MINITFIPQLKQINLTGKAVVEFIKTRIHLHVSYSLLKKVMSSINRSMSSLLVPS
ncbi:hypothetical protein IQ02_01138 [Flavobacterium glaciei]|uniref:Uncharacterized protein n=1 Tax=Flavobacterium glaciei TaxID=386300 RepID=A0A562PYA6_9FLAO|nr:hypothetical protein DFR66_104145 [Flavobacterium glaciei]TWI49150.1 hypothetical protein IQ02_01138 [Flavobacterium glaciei]